VGGLTPRRSEIVDVTSLMRAMISPLKTAGPTG
jgi:hypothetical protein